MRGGRVIGFASRRVASYLLVAQYLQDAFVTMAWRFYKKFAV